MVVFTWILSRVQHKIAYFVKWLPFRPWKESGMSLYPKIFVSYCPSSVPNFMLVSPKAHFFYISARLSIRPFIIVGGLTFVIDFFAVKTRGGLFRTTRWWPILRHLLVPCVGWHSVMVMGHVVNCVMGHMGHKRRSIFISVWSLSYPAIDSPAGF